MDPQTARERLEQMLAELDSSAATFAHTNGDSGEPSHLDQHSAEAASELTVQERDVALRTVVEEQRAQVQAALERLAEGTYGKCVECGSTLPDERLEARPEAARCLSCQHNLELAR